MRSDHHALHALDETGNRYPSPDGAISATHQQLAQEQQRADYAEQQLAQERQKHEHLLNKLRQQGIDPDSL